MKTRTLPAQSRAAVIRAETWDEERKTVIVDWTTGAVVRRYDWWSDQEYDEELIVSKDAINGERLDTGAMAVLNSHRASRLEDQIGVVESWSIDEKARTASAVVRFSERDDVAGIVKDIRNKIIRNISVGYSIDRVEVDKTTSPPTYRATRWTPKEISFVPIGADGGARTRSQPQQDGTPCVFVEDDTMDNEEKGAADPNGQRAEQQPPTAPTVDHAARAAEIVELSAKHGFGERAAEWIRSNASLDQVRAAILSSLAERDAKSGGHINRTSVSAGEDQSEKTRSAMVNAIMARARSVDPATKQIVRFDGANEFRGASLLDMARASLDRAGVNHRGLDKMALVGRAFTQGQSDFPILLETAMYKTLQGAYATAPDTWSRFCSVGSVTDFRAHNRYRVGSLGNLAAVNEHGEFTSKAIPDGERSKISASTKGYIINLTRQAIVNDDLGAFVGLAAALGRAARRTIEADVYALLASNPTLEDGVALFHATHGNLVSSGSSAPTVDAFENMRQLMAVQEDVGGNDYLDLRPAIWLGPMGYGGEARVINAAEYDPAAGANENRPNKVRGLVSDIVDTPRISNNYWYLFANPSDAPVIEVAFLDGQSEPFLDMEEGFTVDGTRWKVRLDFGVAAIDYRGAVRNNGA